MGVQWTARTAKKRITFLRVLAESGNISLASRQAFLGRSYLYKHRDRDPSFAAAWDRALNAAADTLEAEARRRALHGVKEPVFYQGDVCGHVQKYSDTLLIFLLKGLKPDKFADRRQISGPGGGPQQHVHYGDLIDRLLTDADGKTRGLPGPHELPPDEFNG